MSFTDFGSVLLAREMLVHIKPWLIVSTGLDGVSAECKWVNRHRFWS
jgi:hypothetical protein